MMWLDPEQAAPHCEGMHGDIVVCQSVRSFVDVSALSGGS